MTVPRATALLVPALVAVLAYTGTLGHDLVWDDLKIMPLVDGQARDGGLAKVLTSEFRLDADVSLGYFRPVAQGSFWLDTRFAALGVRSAHAVNVILHAATTTALAALLLAAGASAAGALVGGLVFAVHPVHVEAVAFVSGRTDLLAGAFLLASTLAWMRLRRRPTRRAGVVRSLSLLAFGLACLSKESAFMLPPALVAWDALSHERADARSWWSRNRAWLAGWATVIIVVLVLRWLVVGVGFGGLGVGATARDPVNLDWTAARIPGVVVTYLRLLAVPWPLNAYYTPRAVLPSLADGLAAAFLVGVAIAAAAREGRPGAVALAWIAAFILPVSGLVPIAGAVAAERFLYLPSVGVALLAAFPPPIVRAGWRRAAWTAVIALTTVFAVLTVVRARVWKDEVTLFSDIVRTSPDWPAAYYDLGIAWKERGKLDEARRWFETAVDRQPVFVEALTNLGIVYQELGSPERAIEVHRRAIAAREGYVAGYNNLGNALLAADRADEAVTAYREALRLAPDLAPARHNLGIACLRLGRPDLARAELSELARLDRVLAESLAGEIRRYGPPTIRSR